VGIFCERDQIIDNWKENSLSDWYGTCAFSFASKSPCKEPDIRVILVFITKFTYLIINRVALLVRLNTLPPYGRPFLPRPSKWLRMSEYTSGLSLLIRLLLVNITRFITINIYRNKITLIFKRYFFEIKIRRWMHA
jgi:hypothetical protein